MLMVVMIRLSAFIKPLSLPLLALGLFVATLGVTAGTASAITSNGLDANEFGGSNARYALENTSDVSGADYVQIPVYYLNTGAPVSAGSKPPGDMTILINEFGARTSTTMQVSTDGGASWSAATRSDFRFTISRAKFTYRADINGWEASYKARLSTGNGRVQYRANIEAPSGSAGARGTIAKIGYSSANGSNFATANRDRCDRAGQAACNAYFNYRLAFGTPCTEVSNRLVSAYIYDGDNRVGSVTTAQGPRKFSVQLRDVTTGALTNIGPVGSEDNQGIASYPFTVQPKHKYEFIVNNVYTNNVLQFKLPYDSIDSLTDCNYSLSPSTTVAPTIAEPATLTPLTSTGYVTNNGTSISDDVNWQYTRCRIAPGANPAQYAQAADNTSNGVSTYNAKGASCQQVSSGSTKFVRGLNTVTSDSQPMPDIPPGSRVCYIMSVNPPTNTSASNVWKHSTPSCVLFGKQPKVHVLGGDLWVGRLFAGVTATVPTSKIQTSLTVKDKIYGSWTEYGALSTGAIIKLGTGSAYANGGASGMTSCDAAPLSFANTITTNPCAGTSAVLGGYKSNQTVPNVAGSFKTTSATPTLSGTQSLTNLNGLYKTSGNLTISGGQIAKGRAVIINAAGATVTIEGNINYDSSPLTSTDQIPQVVIIAGTINIKGASSAGAVSNIDAWLVASSTVNTCYDAGVMTSLTLNICATPLVINGPVMTSNLQLWRTAGAGAGTSAADPAEVINLRPDAYLWGIYKGSQSGRLETTYQRELPPRF